MFAIPGLPSIAASVKNVDHVRGWIPESLGVAECVGNLRHFVAMQRPGHAGSMALHSCMPILSENFNLYFE